jgi:hypothetical protein
VIEDGRGGYLVPPRSPDALAARILDLVVDPNNAQAMARGAADLVRREFGLKLIVARYTWLYRTLLAAQRKRCPDAGADANVRNYRHPAFAQGHCPRALAFDRPHEPDAAASRSGRW